MNSTSSRWEYKALLLSLLVVPGLFAMGQSYDTVRVENYGIRPNSFEAAVPAIQKAIEACRQKKNAVLLFPKGRYDFWPSHAVTKEYYISNTSSEAELPQKKYVAGMLFEDCKNLIIEGDSSLFVFHGKMTCWVFDH